MDETTIQRAADLWVAGKNAAEIAAELGLAHSTVRVMAQRHRNIFPARFELEAVAKMREQAAELWRAGLTAKAIAEMVGATASAVTKWTNKYRDQFPARENAKAVRAELVASNVAKRAAATVKEEWPDKAPGFPGVTSARLDPCGCKYPLWGHHESFDYDTSLYCGAPRSLAASYCGFHATLAAGPGTRSERGAIKAARAVIARETVRVAE